MIKLFNINIDVMKLILPIIYIILGIITFSIIKKLILDSGKNSKRFKVLQNQRIKTLKITLELELDGGTNGLLARKILAIHLHCFNRIENDHTWTVVERMTWF